MAFLEGSEELILALQATLCDRKKMPCRRRRRHGSGSRDSGAMVQGPWSMVVVVGTKMDAAFHSLVEL
jgi:hypothetical protein